MNEESKQEVVTLREFEKYTDIVLSMLNLEDEVDLVTSGLKYSEKLVNAILSSEEYKEKFIKSSFSHKGESDIELNYFLKGLIYTLAEVFYFNDPVYSEKYKFTELIRYGAIGIEKAAKNFDPTMGYEFPYYAFPWIRREIGSPFHDLFEVCQESVCKVVSEILDVELGEVRYDSHFQNHLGADSLDTLQLVMAFEEACGIEIPNEEAEGIETVGDAVELILKKRAGIIFK